MAPQAASEPTGRAFRRLLMATILLTAGTVFTVCSSWWFAANDSARYTQESFRAERGGQTFWCARQQAWGITRWSTSADSPNPVAAPTGIPSWVIAPSGPGELFDTVTFGWPLRALYR